jgi:hypothetical protein
MKCFSKNLALSDMFIRESLEAGMGELGMTPKTTTEG